jgi:antitoxin Phd
MITKTSAEAQNQFGQLLDTVQREPVVITRHGRPTALVLSARELEEYRNFRVQRRKKLAADWEKWREKARESMTPAASALTQEEITRMVHELR